LALAMFSALILFSAPLISDSEGLAILVSFLSVFDSQAVGDIPQAEAARDLALLRGQPRGVM
jgi:hypothetical protein